MTKRCIQLNLKQVEAEENDTVDNFVQKIHAAVNFSVEQGKGSDCLSSEGVDDGNSSISLAPCEGT